MPQVRVPLVWTFEQPLESRQSELIAGLKPEVAAWGHRKLLALLERLKEDEVAQSSMATELIEFERECILPAGEFGRESVYVFVAMIVNRDLPTTMIAMVAASKEHAELMGDAWLKDANATLGLASRFDSGSFLAPKLGTAEQQRRRRSLFKVALEKCRQVLRFFEANRFFPIDFVRRPDGY
jgi:hypothetical protein